MYFPFFRHYNLCLCRYQKKTETPPFLYPATNNPSAEASPQRDIVAVYARLREHSLPFPFNALRFGTPGNNHGHLLDNHV